MAAVEPAVESAEAAAGDENATIHQAAVREVHGREVHMVQGAAGAVQAEDVSLVQSAVGLVRADEVSISMGGAGVILGDRVRIAHPEPGYVEAALASERSTIRSTSSMVKTLSVGRAA